VPLLAATGIARSFGPARVLRGVDLVVEPGSLHLILGPNGAGKTTLLRILAGLTRPSAGSVTVDGKALRESPGLRRRIGLLSHQSFLYDDLTPLENLEFAARLYDLASPRDAARRAIESVGLADRMDDPVRRLSRGMVQRVAIARALLHEPEVLLLDEPFTGLDPRAAERLLELLSARLAANCGVVLVTHSPGDAWSIASRVSLLVRGKWIIDEARPADLHAFMARASGAFGD
jgi:heme ABC exporter ATP-binding subunit CcmA